MSDWLDNCLNEQVYLLQKKVPIEIFKDVLKSRGACGADQVQMVAGEVWQGAYKISANIIVLPSFREKMASTGILPN